MQYICHLFCLTFLHYICLTPTDRLHFWRCHFGRGKYETLTPVSGLYAICRISYLPTSLIKILN